MLETHELFSYLVAFIILIWIVGTLKSKEPNGPWGVPILGYLPFVRIDAHKQFRELAEKYGNIFTLHLGFEKVVVLNDFRSIKEAFQGQTEIFSARPNTYLYDIVLYKKDIFSCDGPINTEQRRFSLSVLRDFGVGKSGAEKIVAEESEILISKLKEKSGQLIDLDRLFFVAILNVSWAIAAGKRFEYDDETMLQFAENMKYNFKFFSAANRINFFPILRYLDGGKNFSKFLDNNKKIYEFLQKTVDEHKASFVPGNEPRDFADVYIAEILKRKEEQVPKLGKKDEKETHPFSEQRLLGVLYNFMNAGVETTAVTLYWGALYMATWPEIQLKVQEELDRVIGRSRQPQYTDRYALPYTDAVTLEVQRFASIVPLGVAHRTFRTTQLFEHQISGDTVVLSNLYAVHHDPKLWGDPEVFRPERFIGQDDKVTKPEYFIPFSIGGRFCLGEKLARMEIFVFFAQLMQNFTFGLQPNCPTPSLEPEIGVTLRPRPYSIMIENRSFN